MFAHIVCILFSIFCFCSPDGSTPYITLTQFAKLTPTSLTQFAATLNLDTPYNREQVSEHPKDLSKSLADSSTSYTISQNEGGQANGSSMESDLTLEPSLRFQDLIFKEAQDTSSNRYLWAYNILL